MLTQKSNIGLDIGVSSIKLVELLPISKTENKYKLLNFSLQPIINKKEEALAEIINKAKSKNKFVNIAISGEPVIVRLITLPRMSQKELNDSLKFEAEKYIPFNINEVEIQAQILKEKASDNKMQVLLAAAKKKNIEELVSLITGTGANINIIDVNSFAIYNAFEFSHPEFKETCLLLNIGAKSSNINILEEGALNFCRDIFIGGEAFTQTLANTFGLDQAKAENLKRNPQEKKQEVLDAIRPVLFNLKSELSSSIDYFESQTEKKINKIYLSGGGACSLDLNNFFKENFDIEVEIWDVLSVIDIDPALDAKELKRIKCQLVTAVGLALRS